VIVDMHAHEPEASFVDPSGARRHEHRVEPAGGQPAGAGHLDVLSAASLLHLQRLAGNASVNSLLAEEERSPVHDVVGSGGGSPLDTDTRGLMESRLGHDFSDVRVHTDGKAHESAQSINAQAYTVGSDVVFQSGKYEPATDSGRHVLAHELTHVVQQRSGPVDGTPAPGGIRISDPSDPFERAAEQSAASAMSEPAVAAPASAGGAAVQRQEEEEEPVQALAVQALAVQREADEEEEPA
jgi:hypothetical protein